jgi:hypothetical protein
LSVLWFTSLSCFVWPLYCLFCDLYQSWFVWPLYCLYKSQNRQYNGQTNQDWYKSQNRQYNGQTKLLSVLWFISLSRFVCPLYCVLWFTSLSCFVWPLYCLFCDLYHCPVLFGHCIVCSVIYCKSQNRWYNGQTIQDNDVNHRTDNTMAKQNRTMM